ncbi:unconventional prefoldin RPB5 interactor-like protein [Ochlerotatus camptorhynchus]|uniref:unconventional prefoldin RPB5 interactor-like protein n=1 Tax=Ochlerotatus camptorhynchus TaxID=644619 RepID=UPI0031E12C24
MEGINLYNQAYTDALINNELETDRWKSYRAEHEQVKENLQMYRKQLKVDILIPVGSKAFIPGQLYHTGEVMASHGCGYFSDCSAEQANQIIDHRISAANEVLRKYEKEKEMLTNKMEVPFAEDAFGGKEIIEEYDEVREEIWRKEHRIRTRQLKLHEADERRKYRVSESDQDILDRLKDLELMEELEQEIDNLEISVGTDEQLRKLMSGELKLPEKTRVAHNIGVKVGETVSMVNIDEEAESGQFEVETTDEDSSEDSDDSDADVTAEFLKLLQDTKSMNKKDKIQAFKNKLNETSSRLRNDAISVGEKVDLCGLRYEVEEALDFLNPAWENTTVEAKKSDVSKKTKSIKFADADIIKIIDDHEDDAKVSANYVEDSNKTLELKIIHSPESPVAQHSTNGDDVGSPADIYRLFEHCLYKNEPVVTPVEKKSILKNRDMVLAETHLIETQPVLRKPRQKPDVMPIDIVGDVVEHKTESDSKTSAIISIKPGQKKVSRFRQQRQ